MASEANGFDNILSSLSNNTDGDVFSQLIVITSYYSAGGCNNQDSESVQQILRSIAEEQGIMIQGCFPMISIGSLRNALEQQGFIIGDSINEENKNSSLSIFREHDGKPVGSFYSYRYGPNSSKE